MPYTKIENRKKFKAVLFPFLVSAELNRLSAGDLNYLFTAIIDRQLKDANYARMNEIVGALECCKQEFIRRKLNPYEDKKIAENGDVYSQ